MDIDPKALVEAAAVATKLSDDALAAEAQARAQVADALTVLAPGVDSEKLKLTAAHAAINARQALDAARAAQLIVANKVLALAMDVEEAPAPPAPEKPKVVLNGGYDVAVKVVSTEVKDIVQAEVQCTGKAGLFVGWDAWGYDTPMPSEVVVTDCHFTDKGHPIEGKYGIFGIYTHQGSETLRNVTANLGSLSQHFRYGHGFGAGPVIWDNVKVTASGAEIFKQRTPPHRRKYPESYGFDYFDHNGPYNSANDGVFWLTPGERPQIIIENSDLRNWAAQSVDPTRKPWGGGIVLQGSGADLTVRDTLLIGGGDFVDDQGRQRTSAPDKLAIGIDNGARLGTDPPAEYGEYFLKDGSCAPHDPSQPANGQILFEDCIIYIPGVPDKVVPIMRLMHSEGFIFQNCIIASHHDVRIGMDDSPVTFYGCNAGADSNIRVWADEVLPDGWAFVLLP